MVQIWGLGDLIMTLPVVAEIAQRYPHARLSVIVRGEVQAALLKDSSLNLNVLNMPPSTQLFALARFFLQLRRHGFDIAYFGTRTTPLHAIAMRVLSGVRTIIGDSERFAFLYTHHSSVDPQKHRVTRMLETLSLWDGKQCSNPRFPISISKAAEADAIAQLRAVGASPDRFLIIHPGSGRGLGYREKRLPAPLVHGLIQKIRDDFPKHSIVLIFGPDDLDLLPLFTNLPSGATVLRGVRLDTTNAILSRSAAFVGGDTALGHIAAVFGVPTITVAGPTNIDESHPFGVNANVIKRSEPLPCQPCWNTPLHGRCPYSAACMTSLSIDEVYQPLRDRLSDDDRGNGLRSESVREVNSE